MSLALGVSACASEALPDEQVEALPQVATAIDPTYQPRGPYETVTTDNLGVGFETDGIDDTSLCRLIGPSLTSGQGTKEEIENFVVFPRSQRPKLHQVTRPKVLEAGKKYPVIVWANGTCAHSLLYTALLQHMASYGFIVIAPNLRQLGEGTAVSKAIDFLQAENGRPLSPFYQKVDLERIGAIGHSQGGDAVVRAADADPRIKSILPILTASVPWTSKIPTFLLAGTDDPIALPASIHVAFAEDSVGPTWYGLLKGLDHIEPATTPDLIDNVVIAWFYATLNDDPAAKAWFYGPTCTLCTDPSWTIETKHVE